MTVARKINPKNIMTVKKNIRKMWNRIPAIQKQKMKRIAKKFVTPPLERRPGPGQIGANLPLLPMKKYVDVVNRKR